MVSAAVVIGALSVNRELKDPEHASVTVGHAEPLRLWELDFLEVFCAENS